MERALRRRKQDSGQRGKYAEGKVKVLLGKLSDKYADFDFERKYDARSAGGRFPSQVADYGFFRPEVHGLLEVKEIAHDRRLPKDKLSQLARLHKRQLAGSFIVVLILHTTIGAWRLVPFNWLWERREQASWDLSEFPSYAQLEDVPGLISALVGIRALKK